jgi:ABC-type sugar transport system permease subunit
MKKNQFKRNITPYLFIAPFLISFVLFFIIPSVYSLILSFYKYAGYGEAKWVGLQNYQSIFTYQRFWDALKRTLFYWLAKFVPVTVVSFMLAWVLRGRTIRDSKAGKFFKPVLFIPQICSTTAVAIIFEILFARQTGVINQLFGLDIGWIDGTTTVKWVVLILLIWRSIGWFMVVYMSGMSAISDEITEAALIDGASEFQTMIHITIPMMKSTFEFAFIMDAISSLRIFTEPAVLTDTSGNLSKATAEGVINLLMANIQSGNFGMASAYGWVLFVIIFVVSMFIFSAMRDKEGGRVK